ncbi:hypothetical protein THIX_90670 [Thiomonas sp. X19]|nr:hypothetical protein THIX_90670 [Thiomonas sp. X19]
MVTARVTSGHGPGGHAMNLTICHGSICPCHFQGGSQVGAYGVVGTGLVRCASALTIGRVVKV